MKDQSAGMGATVGARKLNEDDEVVQAEGDVDDSAPIYAKVTVFVMAVLSVWKITDIVLMLL